MPISRRTLLQGFLGSGVPGFRGSGVPNLGTSEPRNFGTSIRLDRNESAYGPSAAVLAAIRDIASSAACRYPDVEADTLRRKIAAAHRVAPEHVVLGCGSGDILRSAIEVFAGPKKKIVVALPVFDSIRGWAERAGVQVVGVPLDREYAHDTSAMLAGVDADTSLVHICNPHNPTGRITRRATSAAFLRKLPSRRVVLIDEASHY